MSSGPQISVIIIFHQAEPRFFGEAVQSVLAQTYRSWELLLVDDGSTDDISVLARRFADEHPELIRYLEHPGHENRGMSATRNLGLAEARGRWIAFLDADDVYLPERLARHAALLEQHSRARMVYGPTMLWHSWSGRKESPPDQPRYLGLAPERLYEPPELIARYLRRHALPPSTCGFTMHRDAALRIGGFEESFRGMYEDQAFLYKFALIEPVFVTAECLDWYRIHEGSATAAAETSGYYDGHRPNRAHLDFLRWLETHAAPVIARDPQVASALRSASWPYRHPLLARLLYKLQGYPGKIRRLLGVH